MPELKPCEDAKILARVGSDVILAGDVMALVIHEILGRTDDPVPAEQREQVLKSRLNYAVETKLLYLDARRSIPEENFPNVEKQLEKHFRTSELPPPPPPPALEETSQGRNATGIGGKAPAGWVRRWSGRNGSSWNGRSRNSGCEALSTSTRIAYP